MALRSEARDLKVCRWGGADLPPVALLLVQLELVLVDIELFNEGVPVGIAQVLVCVIEKELVVQLFLPPPQLATGGVQFLFALLEGKELPCGDNVFQIRGWARASEECS